MEIHVDPQMLLEALPVAVARFAATGELREANARFFEWLGCAPGAGHTWAELAAQLEAAALPSEPSEGVPSRPERARLRGRDALERVLEVTVTPAGDGDQVVTLVDVSAATAQIAAAEARDQWLRQVLHRSPYPVVLFDRGGHFREANQAYVDYWHGQLPPPEYTFLDDPIGALQLGPDFMAKLHRGEACRSEEFWWNPHRLNPAWPDIEHCLELIIEPIFTATGVLDGFMLIYDDRTEMKRLQEQMLQQQRLESVGHLAASIAHDFNNYLTSLFAHVSLAERELDDPAAVGERLRRIKAVSRAAAALTYQLVTYSRGGEPLLERVALGPIVEEAVAFTLRGSAVEVVLDLPEDTWVVEADAGQLRQVVSNLVLNAQQVMEGGGTLTVRLRNLPHSAGRALGELAGRGDFVRLSIEDTGPGIPPERLVRVFEPFFTTRPSGQGLGLSTARDIVRKHLGRLTVQSAPGEGARFDLYLPALRFATVSEAPPATVYRGFGTVLLMDDDEALREAAGAMLVYLGYEVFTAPEGGTALALYDAQRARGARVDLVIADYTVRGGMGGQPLLEALLERDPAVRVILSSGYADGPVLSRFQELGFCARLPKPYAIEELSAAVYHQLPHVMAQGAPPP